MAITGQFSMAKYKEVKDRDAQFVNIAETRKKATEARLPIISIDTKRKELIGNFKRNGKVMAIGQSKSLFNLLAIVRTPIHSCIEALCAALGWLEI